MDDRFFPFFARYEAILKQADDAFAKVAAEYPGCVKCRIGCSDCCYALFDLTLIEALYINHQFLTQIPPGQQESLREKANRADRQSYKIKRDAYKRMEAGEPEADILSRIAQERIRCPLLNNDDKCDLYKYRPATCRFYGIPTSIHGRGHTCGLSGFSEGVAYPTVKLDLIQNALIRISEDLLAAIGSRYVKMTEMLVPLSMAIITDYNDVYLGLPGTKDDASEPAPESATRHGGR